MFRELLNLDPGRLQGQSDDRELPFRRIRTVPDWIQRDVPDQGHSIHEACAEVSSAHVYSIATTLPAQSEGPQLLPPVIRSDSSVMAASFLSQLGAKQ